MRVLRGFTGLLAGGLVALVLALGVAWALAAAEGAPGPGPVRVLGHLVAAVVAVAAQRYADRNAGGRAAVAALAVVVVTVLVLVVAWIA
ncbi:hypothetical protein ACQEVB_12615 [Pseudonocardia sp. CA-107938]|uniref:hypothetical protein n=1 Tax=Pseudonocardia sp. CA-107938 TaxID=3240021 RepID=UPI003D8E3DF7